MSMYIIYVVFLTVLLFSICQPIICLLGGSHNSWHKSLQCRLFYILSINYAPFTTVIFFIFNNKYGKVWELFDFDIKVLDLLPTLVLFYKGHGAILYISWIFFTLITFA